MMDSLLLYKGYGHSVSTKLSNKMLEISLNVLKTLNNISTLNNESIKVKLIFIHKYGKKSIDNSIIIYVYIL